MNDYDLPQVDLLVAGHHGSKNSTSELLLDTDFQCLMGEIGQLGVELMNQLDLEMKQMDELISQMDILETPVAMDDVAVTEEAMGMVPDEEIAGKIRN